MKQEFATVTYESKNNIGVITLNRPDVLNAFNWQQVDDLNSAAILAENDDEARVVVLTSNGRAFSAGADLADRSTYETKIPRAADTEQALMTGYHASFSRLVDMPKTVICSVRGPAAGAGAGYALCGDLCIMSESAYIMLAFSNIALVPDNGATWLLARTIGYRRAYAAAIEATKIPASECLNLGIANKVVADDQLEQATLEWAAVYAARAPEAVRMTKENLRKSMDESLEENYLREAIRQNSLIGQPDNVEGVTAFMEKRAPKFTGKKG